MNSQNKLTLFFSAIALSAGGAFIQAASIAITNPGFEDLVLSTPGDFALNNIPGWTLVGQTSTFRPSVASFPGGAPEGNNVAAAGAQLGGGGQISQTLTATVQANTVYTLTIDVGTRLDSPINGYTISLLSGGITLASASSPIPASGTFLTDTITYTSNSDPPQLGANLTIQLFAAGGGQADFDKVRLDATPTPEPSSTMLAAIGSHDFRVPASKQNE